MRVTLPRGRSSAELRPPPPPEVGAGSRPDEQASAPTLRAIFTEHTTFVWRTLRRLGVPDADAEDVCQEVFLVVHRKLAEYEHRGALRTWLYGICVRTASDYRRRAHVRREQVTDALPERVASGGPHHDLERRQALDRLDAALDQLDDDRRAVFVLYEIEELPMSAVAEAIGCPLQTAYSRLHSARKHVKTVMARYDGRTDE